MLAHPSPGHTPVLVCVGDDRGRLRAGLAADADDEQGDDASERHAALTWGAAQLGIAQGVLDAVADGPARGERGADRPGRRLGRPGRASDETAVRMANREAVRARRSATASRAATPRRGGARRPPRHAAQPLLPRRLMRITAVETRRYRCPLDPPFRAAWDPVPRDRQEATLVLVSSDEGLTGFASGGDGLPDRASCSSACCVGVDPLRTEVVRELCETVDFHGGRPWAVEVAVWDLVGKALGMPLWQLLGGRSRAPARLRVERRAARRPASASERCLALRRAGRAAPSSCASTTPTGARTSRSSAPCATRWATGSRSWSTPTRAGACPATASRAGTSRRRRSARGSSSRSASTGSRSRCAPTTPTATRACAA